MMPLRCHSRPVMNVTGRFLLGAKTSLKKTSLFRRKGLAPSANIDITTGMSTKPIEIIEELSLPEDLDTCHSLLRDLHAAYTRLQQIYEALLDTCRTIKEGREKLEQEKEKLELTVQQLTRKLYGRKSERQVHDPNQKWLDFGEETPVLVEPDPEEAQQIIDDYEEKKQQRRKKRRRKRKEAGRFPAHLERRIERIEPELPEGVSPEDCTLISVDTVEILDLEPPRLFVRQLEYPKYRLPEQAEKPEPAIVQGERQVSLISGGSFGFGLAAEITNQKFGLHVPLYRQQDMFSSFGWTPGRSTLCRIVATTADLLTPLVSLMTERILGGSIIYTDDTTLKLLTPGEGQGSRTARQWIYVGTEAGRCYDVFAFTKSRSREGPDSFLEQFTGVLVGDCYSGYVNIEQVSGGRIQFAACHAHARRYVERAEGTAPELWSGLMSIYDMLYDVEDRGRTLEPGERLKLRGEQSAPLMKMMEKYLTCDEAMRLLPKSPMGTAVNYLRGHWDAFCRFLSDGQVEIDNNISESHLRRVAIGRRNWLFVGSEQGGDRVATILSVVASAHRHNLDLWSYLKDVLEHLASGTSDLESLLPDKWKQSHPESVREFREEERRDIAERKRYRRAQRRLARIKS